MRRADRIPISNISFFLLTHRYWVVFSYFQVSVRISPICFFDPSPPPLLSRRQNPTPSPIPPLASPPLVALVTEAAARPTFRFDFQTILFLCFFNTMVKILLILVVITTCSLAQFAEAFVNVGSGLHSISVFSRSTPRSQSQRKGFRPQLFPPPSFFVASFSSSTSPSSPASSSLSSLPLTSTPVGRISLVGSGPGDPNLLTLSAHKILLDPTALFVVDRLVSSKIVNLIAGEVKIARKHPGCADQAQQEIYDWVQEGVKEGRHVVRLKIGDPFVFGRGGEEVLKFREMGVEPTVIPVRKISLLFVTTMSFYLGSNRRIAIPLSLSPLSPT